MFVYTRTEHSRITTQVSESDIKQIYILLLNPQIEKRTLSFIQSLLFIVLLSYLSTFFLRLSIPPTATTMFAKVKEFFQSHFFDTQWKGKVFAAQVGVTTLAFILGIAKVATRPSNIPMNRMDIMAITMVCHRNRLRRHLLTDLV